MRLTREEGEVTMRRILRSGTSWTVAVAVGSIYTVAALAQFPVERISVASDGSQADASSYYTAISPDGQHVAFASVATNLVSGDTNGYGDAFVHDRPTGVTERVSLGSDGSQTVDNPWYEVPALSGTGRYVGFSVCRELFPDTDQCMDAFLRDRDTQNTEVLALDNTGYHPYGMSHCPLVTPDGRYAAFIAGRALVPEDLNGCDDVYVRDRVTGVPECVSVSSTGAEGDSDSDIAAITPDGRYVVFISTATNLVPGDTNGCEDVFVRDRTNGTTERVSVSSSGAQANGTSIDGAISADGRCIAFTSYASNLVPGEPGWSDVLLRDRVAGTTVCVSVATSGRPAEDWSWGPSISADGRYVAFCSLAGNLVVGDTNYEYDVFVRDMLMAQTIRVSCAASGVQGNEGSARPAIAADTPFLLAYSSYASNLIPNDTNGCSDVFLVEIGPLAVRWPREEAALPPSPLSALSAAGRWLLAPLYPPWAAT